MTRKNEQATQLLQKELGQLAAAKPMDQPIKESLKSKIILNE
jgi:pilus assembly protein CpaF